MRETVLEEIRLVAKRDPLGDSQELARRVVNARKPGDFLELVAREIAHSQRAAHLDSEHRLSVVFRDLGPIARLPEGPDLRELLETPLRLGTGVGDVTWGTATLLQLRTRRAMLERLRATIDADIALLDHAIARLESSGAGCLNELTDRAA